MLKLRPVVEWLRDFTKTRYPLSYSRTYLEQDGRELLLRAQEASKLDAQELWLVFPVAGQGALMTATTRRFTTAIRSDVNDPQGPISAIRADEGTPEVLLMPHTRQGQPSIENIPTARLAELVNAGEPIDFVADTYSLTEDQVEQAIIYEATRRAVS